MPREMTFNEERPIGTRAKHPVEELRKTRWWKPTVLRHRIHVETCKRLDCDELIQPFFRFADEVISTPEPARDSLLALEELQPYEARVAYSAYVSPSMES